MFGKNTKSKKSSGGISNNFNENEYKKSYEILKKVVAGYDMVVCLDINNNSYELLNDARRLQESVLLTGNYNEDMAKQARFVTEGSMPFYKMVSTVEAIRSLNKEDFRELFFTINKEGTVLWVRTTVRTLDKENGYPSKSLLTFTIVPEEVSKQFENKRQQDESMAIIAGLAGNYDDIVYVRLFDSARTDTVDSFRRSKLIRQNIENWEQAKYFHDRLDLFMEKIVHPEDKGIFYDETRRDVVLSAMNRGRSYTVRFRTLVNDNVSNYEMTFVPDRKADSDVLKGFTVGIHNIDSEIDMSRRQEESRIRNLSIIKALSQEYGSVYYYNPLEDAIIPINMSKRIVSMYGQSLRGQKFADAAEQYIATGVIEAEKAEMRKALTVENIKNQLELGNVYKKIFLNNDNHYCEMKIVRAEEETGAFVLGFAVKDDEIRRDLNQDAIMHEITRSMYEKMDIDASINNMLSAVNRYYDAERTTLFEINYLVKNVTSNFFFSRDPEDPFANAKRVRALDDYTDFFNYLIHNQEALVDNSEKMTEFENSANVNFRVYGIENAIIVPLISEDNKVQCFIGIDNPKNFIKDSSIARLALGGCYSQIIRKKENDEELKVRNSIMGSFQIVSYADFIQNKIRIYSASERYDKFLNTEYTFTDIADRYIKADCTVDDYEELSKFLNTENVISRIRKEGSITFYYITDEEGKPRNNELRIIPANEEGTCAVISILDNTDGVSKEREINQKLEKAMEEANAANQSKSDFLSKMSHDIRTPINGVMGMVGIAKRNLDNREKVENCLDKINVASNHLMSLLNDVLDMSKIENGAMRIIRRPFNLEEFANNCVSIIGGQNVDRNITFTQEISDFTYPDILGDELHIRQVILNILTNAFKFTPDGGTIKFSVLETGTTSEHILVRMIVSDTGIGMKPEFLEHIWDAFAQESTESQSRYNGAGLGMAISKNLVDMMGGSISVESEYGKGSTFTIDLKLRINRNVEKEDKALPETSLEGASILLVEDNEINVEISREILETYGAKVVVAENGLEGVKTFEKEKEGAFSAILMDIMMPVMNGYDASRKIRSLARKDALTIPIIAMTANAFDEDVEMARKAGMDAHLSKPVKLEVMVRVVSDYVSGKRKRETVLRADKEDTE